MRKFLLIILIVCASVTLSCKREKVVDIVQPNASGVQEVSGNQSGTWSGKIHIVDDVIVPKGKTLTIKAGATVIADGYFGMTVNGSLYAVGEDNAWISFTVADTTGYSDYDDYENGGWKGITFAKPDVVRLEYCDFAYGKTPLDTDGGMLKIFSTIDMEISNCRFHHNTTRRKGGAIYAANSVLNIHDCEVYDNLGVGYMGSYCWGIGFQFQRSTVNMHDMVFHDNYSESAYGGGMNIDSCNLELTNAVFYNNFAIDAGGLGLQRSKEYNVKVVNMLAYNNYVVHYGGGLAVATSDPELNNLTIVNNYCGGGGGAGMQMAFDAAPTLNNCIFWGNHAFYTTEDRNDRDTIEYYMGSQIWLWGSDCLPMFNNSVVQYGLDTINGYYQIPEDHYNNMLDVNPLFVNEESRDYHLTETSPCVNAGLQDVSGLFIPSFDLDGRQRISGGRIDMGCYESQGFKRLTE